MVTGRRTRRPDHAPHLLTLVALSGLGALTMNIFLPSLPDMAREFQVEYGVMQLSVSAYLLASAFVQITIGPISDSFGRRPAMMVSLLVFLAATVGTLMATTAGWFLLFRMIQATATAGLVLSRAVIRDTVSDDRAAGLIGYVTMGMALVPMAAPVLGGILHEAFGWRANFTMLGVLGIVVLILVWLDMGETARGTGMSLRQQMRGYGVLVRSVRFWGYCLSATTASGCFFAYLGGAPFVGSEVFHLSPAEVGYYFALPALGYVLGNFLSGRYSARWGMNRMVLAGALITTGGVAAALIADMAGALGPGLFFSAICILGLGNGLTMPNALAGMMSVRPELAGSASGFGGAMNVTGGAALAAVAGALLVPGAGAAPLLWIMFLSSLGTILAILWVKRRARRLGRTC